VASPWSRSGESSGLQPAEMAGRKARGFSPGLDACFETGAKALSLKGLLQGPEGPCFLRIFDLSASCKFFASCRTIETSDLDTAYSDTPHR
jgi:hypothetical protein